MKPYEIVNDMEQFTQAETDRINQLAAGNISNPTIEDMELYARWKTSNALADARFKTENDALQAQMKQNMELAQAFNKAAIDNLNAQKELALARLEAVKNGQI